MKWLVTGSAPPTSHNANLEPLVEGPAISLAARHAKATWEYGTARELTPHTVALTPDGERMVLAYLRSCAAGPRTTLHGL